MIRSNHLSCSGADLTLGFPLENCNCKAAQAEAGTLLSCARYEINTMEQMGERMSLPAGTLEKNDVLRTSGVTEHS